MSATTRRGLLRGLALGAASAVIAPVVAPVAAEQPQGAREPAWASEWSPTALPGQLAQLATPEDPCPRCGGRHEWMTKGCLPILFCPDRFGNGWHFKEFTMVDPPDGLHVIELQAERRDHPFRYAVVRKAARDGA